MIRCFQMTTPTALIAGLAGSLLLCWTAPAWTQGVLDRLFGGLQPRPSYETPLPLPPPPGAAVPPAFVAPPSGPGRTHVYCVRLCDGRFFPVPPPGGARPTQ